MITSTLPYSEWMLATPHAHGLDLQFAFTAHLMLLTVSPEPEPEPEPKPEPEQEAEAYSGLDSEEWMDTREHALPAILANGRFPALSCFATTGHDPDLDALFELGLKTPPQWPCRTPQGGSAD